MAEAKSGGPIGAAVDSSIVSNHELLNLLTNADEDADELGALLADSPRVQDRLRSMTGHYEDDALGGDRKDAASVEAAREALSRLFKVDHVSGAGGAADTKDGAQDPVDPTHDFLRCAKGLLKLDGRVLAETAFLYLIRSHETARRGKELELRDLTSLEMIQDFRDFYFQERLDLLRCLQQMASTANAEEHPLRDIVQRSGTPSVRDILSLTRRYTCKYAPRSGGGGGTGGAGAPRSFALFDALHTESRSDLASSAALFRLTREETTAFLADHRRHLERQPRPRGAG